MTRFARTMSWVPDATRPSAWGRSRMTGRVISNDGILAWFDSRIANGLIEGINSLVQAAKAKARGYRNRDTLKAITYLIAGKLDLRLPT